jgi:hypothetical protein
MIDKIKTEIANAIIEEMNTKNPLWCNYSYKIIASSSLSSAFDLEQKELLNIELNSNWETVWLRNINDKLVDLFKNLNVTEKLNVVEFLFENKTLIEVKTYWLQSVQDEFEMYLPKSKKGKIKAWYLPTDNLQTELINNNMQLPKTNVHFDTSQLNIDKAFFELNKIVYYPEDNLWDGGFYSISKAGGDWSGTSALYLYEDIDEKQNGQQAVQTEYDLIIKDDIKKLFQYIVDFYKDKNPTVPFDSIFVTVQNDGRYVVNFEFEGEEVSPAAPPMPDTITAEYLCENLFNCLVDNAPDNFMWAWEIIKREKTASEGNSIGGEFYYSINADKSNPQKLVPGEYIFMYNVTEQLFDDFFDVAYKNWSEVKLIFSANGKVDYEILRRM